MGFFKVFKRVVVGAITFTASEAGPISKKVTGKDLSFGISKGLSDLGGGIIDAGAAVLKNPSLLLAQPPSTIQVNVPGQTQTISQPINTNQPIPRAGISGGPSAFGDFGIGRLGGGNPAWRSSGASVTLSQGVSQFSGGSGGTWVSSGNSVRLQ